MAPHILDQSSSSLFKLRGTQQRQRIAIQNFGGNYLIVDSSRDGQETQGETTTTATEVLRPESIQLHCQWVTCTTAFQKEFFLFSHLRIEDTVLNLDYVSLPVWWTVFSGSPLQCWSHWLGWPQRWSRCIPYTETSYTGVSGIFHRSRRNSRAGRSTGRSKKTCSGEEETNSYPVL